MSLRLFVCYCMVCGAWSGFIGWVLGAATVGLLFSSDNPSTFRFIMSDSLKGMFLGLTIAFGLSFLDAFFNLSFSQLGKFFMRVFLALIVGIIGSFLGSLIGSSLYQLTQRYDFSRPFAEIFYLVGWTMVGFLIGLSICFFELLGSAISRKDLAGSIKKFIKCAIGGTLGGIIGGLIAFSMLFIARRLVGDEAAAGKWSPTAIGFVALGACIGLLVGLAQLILKEAWIKVEAGFRPGREMILTKERTSIGRAEGSDIALFGDSGVEKAHAFIVLERGRYYLEDQATPGGSYVNDQKVDGRFALKAGDLIRVGKSVLRFNERVKRKD